MVEMVQRDQLPKLESNSSPEARCRRADIVMDVKE